ncbi:MAG TPA: PfkB family carbohydrate kinase, partial [Rhodothermales bacterium]|nr:PfkB family carbohydrate kinase [Rhodothermales bacterium]
MDQTSKDRESMLLVVGSANMDLVVTCDRFPEPGETVFGGSFATYPGGKGANQAVAAARLEGDVLLLAKLGSDAFGDEL